MANLQQTLMQGNWVVLSADASAAGELAQNDKFQFMSDMSIQRVAGSSPLGPWAGPCTPTVINQNDGLLGFTKSQRQFSIQVAGSKILNCYFGAARRRRWLLDVTAFLFGTLAGGIVGAATGSLRIGLLSGAAAAAAATFAMAQGNMAGQTGPSATLTVDDGQSGGPMDQPDPGPSRG